MRSGQTFRQALAEDYDQENEGVENVLIREMGDKFMKEGYKLSTILYKD